MAYQLNQTHDPSLKSWVESANQKDCHFPIQNLPLGVFSTQTNPTPRVGVAIGDCVLDLAVLHEAGLLSGFAAGVFAQQDINTFLALGKNAWSSLRAQLSALLRVDNPLLKDQKTLVAKVLIRDFVSHLPMKVQGYTDFYSSKEHATNAGSMFRDPKNALLPNWLHIPIGYNGRASSVVVSGTNVKRPNGQLKLPDQDQPIFAPCRKLDFELETAFVVGQGNALGEPISVQNAEDHIYGMVLLNDWSARDIQQWEYVPLGPFNSKTFASSISPWVVSLEALAPFRVPTPVQDPKPLPYLTQSGNMGVDIDLYVYLKPANTAEEKEICHSNFKYLYWSMAQQLAHHTVSGCNTQTGDLMGSGTISGPNDHAFGSLLELTWNGSKPIDFGQGITRSFIEDGDTILMSAVAKSKDFCVGFGEVVGQVLPAPVVK
jgi:fumarylacetoacetase